MAQQGTTTRKSPSIKLPHYTGDTITSGHPFQVLSVKQDIVKVSAYSSLLEHMDIRKFIPIIGLDYEFQIKYGDKIYLEIIFDSNNQVIAAQIRHDSVWWKSRVSRPKLDGTTDQLPVYPSEIELISKLDLLQKINELRDSVSQATKDKDAAIASIKQQLANQVITQDVADSSIKKINTDFQAFSDKMTKFLNIVNNFFGTNVLPPAPSNIGRTGATKKQFRAYKLIANTTKDLSPKLIGPIIHPDPTTKLEPFRLVQCLDKDLMLVDVCFNNVGCRVPILWSKPIYYYETDNQGTVEDEKNTGVKG